MWERVNDYPSIRIASGMTASMLWIWLLVLVEPVVGSEQLSDFWKNVSLDTFDLYYPRLCGGNYYVDLVDEKLEFLLLTIPSDTSISFDFVISGYSLSVTNADDEAFGVTAAGHYDVKKQYGKWNGYDILPVTVSRYEVMCGNQVVKNFGTYMNSIDISATKLNNWIILTPKKYPNREPCEQPWKPKLKFRLLTDFHVLSLCDRNVGARLRTEGAFSMFVAIPFQCMNTNTTLAAGYIDQMNIFPAGQMPFSIVGDSKSKQLFFVFKGTNRRINSTDLVYRFGYVLVPLYFHPRYFYVGENFNSYNLDTKTQIALSKITITPDKVGCPFLFVVPKDQVELENNCTLPNGWTWTEGKVDEGFICVAIGFLFLFVFACIFWIAMYSYVLGCWDIKKKKQE